MNKPVNPLSVLAASGQFESTSRLVNDTPGNCPKCKQTMSLAKVKEEDVFYCEPCRVCQPIPE